MKLKEFTEFISTLAEKSGEVIKQYFVQASLAVETKEDHTLVTQADREAEAVMRELIRKAYPHHGLLGEEFGPENTSAEFIWTLEPIDGTIAFVRGCPLFGTLIGLLHADRPILGAIHHPILHQLCIGNNTETTVNGRAVHLREAHHLSEAVLLTTDMANIATYQK
jgi:myo-inositol-1(or 4)-monophosphatase